MEDFVNIIGVRHSRLKRCAVWILCPWTVACYDQIQGQNIFFSLYVGFSCRNLVQMDYIEKNEL